MISDFLDLFLQSRRAARRATRTEDWYTQQLSAWFVWLRENEADPLSPDDLDSFLVEEADSGLSDSTVAARYRAIRAYLRWCSRRKKINLRYDDLPTSIIDRPQIAEHKPRVADPVDLQKVIGGIEKMTWIDYRDAAMLELLRSTGLRVLEACTLRVGHVNTAEQYVFVLAGKGAKDRLVPFGANFTRAFMAYLFNRPRHESDLLFLASDSHYRPVSPGGDFTTNGVRQMIRRRCNDASVKYINPHSIRHMFAIFSLNQGTQLSAVSAMLGHASVAFTAKVYARWVLAGLRKQYDEFIEEK